MAWWLLLLAGLFEIGWAVGLKYTNGLTRLWPTVGTGIALVASMMLLAMAVRQIPLGTAYAVWTGIGAVGAVILGIFLFGEPASAGRIACLALIVGGIVGLKLLTPAENVAQAQQPAGEHA
jgi:quaternary ammonium compound-resistance protein SugE